MRNPSGYRSLGSCLIAILALTGVSHGATLHFIMMADTLASGIGTEVDLEKAQAWAQTIANYSGLTLNFQPLSGASLTASRARTMLHAVDPGPDDVVYFTYTGHGANPGDSQWPMFTLMTQTSLEFSEVVAILQPKPQRLLIVLADCCNAVVSSGRTTPAFDPSGQTALTAINFQNLFLRFRGMVLASASSQGQYSLGDSLEGGLFLNTYMETFGDLADTVQDLTWQQILAAASADTAAYAASYNETQVPQFVVNTEQVAAETPDPPSSEDPSDDTDPDDIDSDDDVDSDDDTDSDDDETDMTDDSTLDDTSDDGAESSNAPMCAPMAILPLAISACLWAMRRRTWR